MRRLLLLLFYFILTTFAFYASVYVPPALIQNYTIADYKASEQNWELAISSDGILYVANNAGLLTFDGNTWTTYSLPGEPIIYNVVLSNDTIFTGSETSIGYWLSDPKGKLTYTQIDHLPAHIKFKEHPQKVTYPLSEEVMQQKPSAFISIDQFNFVGTLANGIYVTDQDGNSLLHISTRVGLQDNIVHDLCVEKSGCIWAAFDNGLSRIIFNSPLRLLATRSRVGKLLDVTFEDSTLYFKTNTNYYKRKLDTGVYAFPVPEDEVLPFFNRKEKIETKTIQEIVGSDSSLEKLNESDYVYPFADSLYWFTKENEAALVSLKNGDIHLKCRVLFDDYNLNLVYRGQQIFPLNDSLHIASTMQGVLLINSNSVSRSMQNKGLPLRFTKAEYKDYKGTYALDPNLEKISLPHNFQEVTISAGSSVFNLNNQISYKIDNLSCDWSKWQRDGTINLLQLPSGEYAIHVRRYVPIGDYPVITIVLQVHPPWYKTIAAICIFIFLACAVLFTGIRRYLIKQKRREEYQRQAERQKEKQKMQELKNEMLETELQNKKNELMIQTSTLVEKGVRLNKLLEELEHQKNKLGDRYPDKLYSRMRSLIEEGLTNQTDWLTFEAYFNSAHQNFIERFRQKYTDITPGDIRMCCLLRMNLTTKEIASLMNITVRAVELRRYRLRKRIGLDTDTNLVDFLMNF